VRVYIESTSPSYIVARPARDLLQAARQQLAKDWWNSERNKHELFTSQAVLDEIALGEAAMARQRLDLIADLKLVDMTEDARALTKSILASRILPATADRDAAHIALASVHEMDMLLTWNCRHIANATIQTPLRRLVAVAGFALPVICTPEELIEANEEED